MLLRLFFILLEIFRLAQKNVELSFHLLIDKCISMIGKIVYNTPTLLIFIFHRLFLTTKIEYTYSSILLRLTPEVFDFKRLMILFSSVDIKDLTHFLDNLLILDSIYQEFYLFFVA